MSRISSGNLPSGSSPSFHPFRSFQTATFLVNTFLDFLTGACRSNERQLLIQRASRSSTTQRGPTDHLLDRIDGGPPLQWSVNESEVVFHSTACQLGRV